ncbi:LOW QUALITY PROTEIN: otoferlin-like [Penaeus chinensis]|uniref:LOW QUALITY PROTEIN: otoferlin-like n=1 Tax=Penaeus chinensis TaxID=139456 RepID=UPI001FB735D3|nr:LOW QUALITY PROTEIN: otoferlin-like [Penaeus chinensis]
MTDANNKLVKILISFEARYIPPPGGGREGRRRRHSAARVEDIVFAGGEEAEGSLGGEGGGIEGGRGLERGRGGGGGGIEGGRGGPERGRGGGGGGGGVGVLDRGGGGLFWDGDVSDVQEGGGYGSGLEDDKQMLLDVEQNIANLERNISMQEKHSGMMRGRKSKENSPEMQKKSRGFAGMKAVRSLVRLGRQRSRSAGADDEERCGLKDADHNDAHARDLSRPPSACSTISDNESTCSLSTNVKAKRHKSETVNSTPAELKAQDFQVCITIIEARQLAGLNMDPVVCVQVGDQKKYTSVKESTNCPYYNEYFVFDFHMAPAMLFDKIITLTVLQCRNILRSNKVLGSFKLDVATVWSQPEHQFYHKWALLTDPDDITGGPKGYLKCDICVVGKGDAIKAPLRNDKDEDDIEGNLLLPDGVPAERQRAKFIVRIYRADGLPKINSSIMANVKKAFTGDSKDLIDPYVQVSFAGLSGRTSVKKNTASPTWNEQIVFTEMFPPLCQRVKIQLRDNDAVNDTVIGTHFLDLTTISNDGDKGFLPTFGPAYVYMYGSTRDGSVMDENSALNAGLGEGIAYRGRVLISVRCQITDQLDVAPSEVEVENTLPIQETNNNNSHFLPDVSFSLVCDKPLSFELSLGNAGNSLDGCSTTRPSSEEESDGESGRGSPPPKVVADGGRRREKKSAERRLKEALEEMVSGCGQYLSIARASSAASTGGRTKLDKERMRLCQREIDHLGSRAARHTKALVTRHSLRDRLKRKAHYKPSQARQQRSRPPTVRVWRSARQAVHYPGNPSPPIPPARHLISPPWKLERGKSSALPGRKSSGPGGWAIQAKLQIYIWLGMMKHKKHFLPGIPKGYETPYELRNIERTMTLPPITLHYTQKQIFQLRAHMYQARSLIASDNSGLSDPFARVIVGEHCRETQVIDETLSPTWDEMLVLDDILVYGTREEMKAQPPLIVVEIFDQDKVGKSEFIGRGAARPPNKNPPPQVLFWGLRDLKRIHLLTVDRPRVDVEVAGHIIQSAVITSARRNPNFTNPVKYIDLELPEQELYCPPITIRVVDCRSFGRFTLVGTHIISNLHRYTWTPTTRREKEAARNASLVQLQGDDPNGVGNNNALVPNNVHGGGGGGGGGSVAYRGNHERSPLLQKDTIITIDYVRGSGAVSKLVGVTKKEKAEANRRRKQSLDVEEEEEENRDWWTKYFASLEAVAIVGVASCYVVVERTTSLFTARRVKFGDVLALQSYVTYASGRDLGSLKLYRWPLPKDIEDTTITGGDPQYGFFQGLPSNDPIHVLVRVYVVRACDLHPMDLNGKADPYILIYLGGKKVSDKENYISKQLNPVFGKCFEIEATFPQDSMLTVQVLDWDLVGSDDMIGETKIDLENRFYSRHRATCGLASRYETTGYNQWRDPMKPTQILGRLCKEGRLDGPHYGPGKVRIGPKTFTLQADDEHDPGRFRMIASEEQLALAVLHRWEEVPKVGCRLVPEHIETRPLYNPDKPGIEQGKIEMWVDMFPMDMPLPGPPLDVTPRKPKSYELRVIIWNTDDVVLEDDAFFTGEKMSDIYVKGWLKGPEDTQCTDIHYRSLTGEGNFNWRFVYPFEYLVAEEKIVISRKESLFSWDETECKIPARLELQVWDADHFSADDFLGAITLDLNRFPRGAKNSKLCTLDMLKTDGSVPMVNIFKQRRVKGWWPFYIKKENEEMELTGKVEAEIHLLTKDEAEKNPAGLGRNEPDPLEKPNRPDASFMWFLNPLKSIRYIIWHNYKWAIIKILVFFALTIFFVLFFYSVPGFTVKKILGA